MARISITIQPLHADGNVCTHEVGPNSQPRDPNSGCTGHRSYLVQCSACGTVGTPHGLRVLAKPEQRKHREAHKAAKAPKGPNASLALR